ncbi:hypothetical protein JTE90_012407 [Oedothorax gibbosus]|uniref:Uncharacterized protein n=1 Tax=Oedothorax gibbosus TaxID=931172 RepID=A0AAV6TXX9_9ARAC|nr:hypothetical protein JTE90_012407 [Oedothorax gibbosus]
MSVPTQHSTLGGGVFSFWELISQFATINSYSSSAILRLSFPTLILKRLALTLYFSDFFLNTSARVPVSTARKLHLFSRIFCAASLFVAISSIRLRIFDYHLVLSTFLNLFIHQHTSTRYNCHLFEITASVSYSLFPASGPDHVEVNGWGCSYLSLENL